MKFRPLHDRVVVRRIDEDMKTTGGARQLRRHVLFFKFLH